MTEFLPDCQGFWSWTDCGNEFDCYAPGEIDCESCLCCYHQTGGLHHPDTGEQIMSKEVARKVYGKPHHYHCDNCNYPDCETCPYVKDVIMLK